MGTKTSGNKQATGKAVKYGSQLASRTRKAILNTFDCIEKDGRLISEILADKFKENPLKFMELAIKAMPKDLNIDNTKGNDINRYTDAELADLIAKRARDQGQGPKKVYDGVTDAVSPDLPEAVGKDS